MYVNDIERDWIFIALKEKNVNKFTLLVVRHMQDAIRSRVKSASYARMVFAPFETVTFYPPKHKLLMDEMEMEVLEWDGVKKIVFFFFISLLYIFL